MILHPNPKPVSYKTLEKAGWKICHLPRVKCPKDMETSRFVDNYSKIYVWNMTGYKRVLFLDADVMVTKDLGPALEMADLLADPGSPQAGPRIAPSVSLIGRKMFSSGCFLIRPDAEEYLWLFNLFVMGKIRVAQY